MAEIVKYELPEAIEDAPICQCKRVDKRIAIVKRKATIIYDDGTSKSNQVIALTFCSECGTYESKNPAEAEETYDSIVRGREQG